MAAWNYEACHAKTLGYEGGYANHPDDPGGPTLEGVTQAVYDNFRKSKGLPRKVLSASMRTTKAWIAERRAIYRTLYWDKVDGDGLPAGVDLAVYDFGVNSGVARANRYVSTLGDGEPIDLVKRLCAKRLGFVQQIRTFKVFGRGWTRRIADVEATGVRMAAQAAGRPVAEVLRDGQAAASRQSKGAAGKGAGAVAAPASTQAPGVPHHVDLSTVEPFLLGLIAGLVLCAAGYFAWRFVIHRQRASAYAAVLKEDRQ